MAFDFTFYEERAQKGDLRAGEKAFLAEEDLKARCCLYKEVAEKLVLN